MLVGGGVGVERDGSTGELHGSLLLGMFGEAEGLLLVGTVEPLLPVHGVVVMAAILLLLLLGYLPGSSGTADDTLPLDAGAGKNPKPQCKLSKYSFKADQE
jgi:hypothetical protein